MMSLLNMNMNLIVDKLFLGGIETLSDIDKLKQLGVSHILTVDIQPPPPEISSQFESKFILVQDVADSDLLSHFEESNAFIEDGREKGGVLVHCFAGVSRSATLVCAYLMNKLNIMYLEAFEIIKTQRPVVKPNVGFEEQLYLFERMGCKIDALSNSFRQYRLMKLSKCVQDGGFQNITQDSLSSPLNEQPNQNLYKCRKCRKTLFKSGVLLSHVAGEGEAAFDWRAKTRGGAIDDKPCDRSIFIEPMKWMISYINTMDGKIPCPHCSAKLGSFVWYGERCPCGTWVAPAFHIQIAKVDICRPVGINHR